MPRGFFAYAACSSAVVLRVEQLLAQRGEDAEQRVRISAAARRREPDVLGDRCLDDHRLRRCAAEVDDRRESSKDAGAGRRERGGDAGALRSGERVGVRLHEIDRRELGLKSDRLERVRRARRARPAAPAPPPRPPRPAAAVAAAFAGRRRVSEAGVRIDEPGVDGESGAVDDARVGGRLRGRADGGDHAVANDDGALVDRRSGDRDDSGIRDGVCVGNVALALNADLRAQQRRGDDGGGSTPRSSPSESDGSALLTCSSPGSTRVGRGCVRVAAEARRAVNIQCRHDAVKTTSDRIAQSGLHPYGRNYINVQACSGVDDARCFATIRVEIARRVAEPVIFVSSPLTGDSMHRQRLLIAGLVVIVGRRATRCAERRECRARRVRAVHPRRRRVAGEERIWRRRSRRRFPHVAMGARRRRRALSTFDNEASRGSGTSDMQTFVGRITYNLPFGMGGRTHQLLLEPGVGRSASTATPTSSFSPGGGARFMLSDCSRFASTGSCSTSRIPALRRSAFLRRRREPGGCALDERRDSRRSELPARQHQAERRRRRRRRRRRKRRRRAVNRRRRRAARAEPPPPDRSGIIRDSLAAVDRAREAVLAKVYFDFDRSELRDDQRAILDAKMPVLRANPGVRIRIEGNADERGSDEYNMALGMRRAQTARKVSHRSRHRRRPHRHLEQRRREGRLSGARRGLLVAESSRRVRHRRRRRHADRAAIDSAAVGENAKVCSVTRTGRPSRRFGMPVLA